MEVKWVDRDAGGKITGRYARKQRDGQESVPADSPELAVLDAERLAAQNIEIEKQQKLCALADWLQANGVPKLTDVVAKVATLETKVGAFETKAVKP